MASLFPDDDQVSLDGENTPDEPITDAAGQTVTADDDDAPLTPSDEAHAKHAAAVALGNPSVAPPPVEVAPRKRAPRKDAGKPRKPKLGDAIAARDMVGGAGVGDPIPGKLDTVVVVNNHPDSDPRDVLYGPALAEFNDTRANVNLNEAINKAALDATCRSPGTVINLGDMRELGSSDIDFTAKAKARLKVYGKFAARARAAAQLWPKEPVRYFDAVSKIFVDLAMGESRVDALQFDKDAVAELVIGLLPKSTVDVIERSGITAL